jgi:hypothetical protein
MIAVHFEPMMSAVQATAQSSSWTGRMVRIDLILELVSGRGLVRARI